MALCSMATAADVSLLSEQLLGSYKNGDTFILTFQIDYTTVSGTQYLMTLADSYYLVSQAGEHYGFSNVGTSVTGQLAKDTTSTTGNAIVNTDGQAFGWYSWKRDLASTACGPLFDTSNNKHSTITLSYYADTNVTQWVVEKPQIGAYGAVTQTVTMSGYKDIDASTITYNDATFAVLADSVTFRSTPAVPEPATGALSLLALCGLASRRRRKK